MNALRMHHILRSLDNVQSMSFEEWRTIRMIRPLPAAILRRRALFGKYGSRTPVIGFFSVYGAFAANSGLGLSSSSCKKKHDRPYPSKTDEFLEKFQGWKGFISNLNICIANRVVKCHGYGGYIRVKMFASWG